MRPKEQNKTKTAEDKQTKQEKEKKGKKAKQRQEAKQDRGKDRQERAERGTQTITMATVRRKELRCSDVYPVMLLV